MPTPLINNPTLSPFKRASGLAVDQHTIKSFIESRPSGLFRLKGFVHNFDGGSWQVQVVGRQTEIRHRPTNRPSQLVAIGLKNRMTQKQIESWWTTA